MNCLKKMLLLLLCSTAFSAQAADKWVRVTSPHFTVYSNAKAGKAKEVALQFEQSHGLIKQVFPTMNVDVIKPFTVIACDTDSSFEDLIPMYTEDKDKVTPAGLYLGAPLAQWSVVNIKTRDNNYLDTIVHEYIHMINDRNFVTMPLWLNEGLAGFFGTFKIKGDKMVVGSPSNWKVRMLTGGTSGLLPWEEVMMPEKGNTHASHPDTSHPFYAQSWGLVHFLLLDPETREQHLLYKYMDLLERQVPNKEAVRQVFGDDLTTLGKAMRHHIGRSRIYTLPLPKPQDVKASDLKVENLSDLDMHLVRLDWFTVMHRDKEADAETAKIEAVAPGHAQVAYAKGLTAYYKGSNEASRVSLMEAMKKDPSHRFAPFFLAEQTSDYASALNHYKSALERNPTTPLVKSAMGYHLAKRVETQMDGYRLILDAISAERGQITHRRRLVEALMNNSRYDDAVKQAEILVNMAEHGNEVWAKDLLQRAKDAGAAAK